MMLLNAKFSQSNYRLNAKFEELNTRLDARIENLQKVTIAENVDPYLGDYTITPKVDAQTMLTSQKFMTDDVQIKAIPFYETSNESDGMTVYIGSEVEIYGV